MEEDTDQRGTRRLLVDAVRNTGWAALGAGTGVVALYTLPFVAIAALVCLLPIGRVLARPMIHWIRLVAGLERRRLRWLGKPVESPYHGYGEYSSLRAIMADPSVRRDLPWMVMHASWGLVLGLVFVQLPFQAVRDISFPFWWLLVPTDEQTAVNGIVPVESWTGAIFTAVSGIAWIAVWLLAGNRIIEYQARPGVNLLAPDPDLDLSARIAELTATRAAALDAHAVELRRIERALHDGSQNRIVAVAVLIGAARREIDRAPERADEILSRAQDTVEEALAELRAVVRTILPPVLENRGLEGALAALASDCAVPCEVTVDVPGRCPASVEATAYFVVAESLTNVAKHSRATAATVEVRRRGDRLTVAVGDDGRGGADPESGSGLAGIVRRVDALDGDTAVTSPLGGPTRIEVELPCGL